MLLTPEFVLGNKLETNKHSPVVIIIIIIIIIIIHH